MSCFNSLTLQLAGVKRVDTLCYSATQILSGLRVEDCGDSRCGRQQEQMGHVGKVCNPQWQLIFSSFIAGDMVW